MAVSYSEGDFKIVTDADGKKGDLHVLGRWWLFKNLNELNKYTLENINML